MERAEAFNDAVRRITITVEPTGAFYADGMKVTGHIALAFTAAERGYGTFTGICPKPADYPPVFSSETLPDEREGAAFLFPPLKERSDPIAWEETLRSVGGDVMRLTRRNG